MHLPHWLCRGSSLPRTQRRDEATVSLADGGDEKLEKREDWERREASQTCGKNKAFNKQREDFRAGLAGTREVASAPSKATFSDCISAVLYKTATKNRKLATAMEYKQACAVMLTAHLPGDPFLNSSEHRAWIQRILAITVYRRGTKEEGGAREEDDVPKLRRPKPSNS
jgi:hypothetical protein